MGDLQRQLESAIVDGDATRARTVFSEIRDSSPGVDLLEEVARLAAADHELATELLVEEVDAQRLMHKFIAGMLLDEAAIEDVAQDCLISIVTSITSYSGRSKFTTWAHRIARNRTVDHLRRQRATAPLVTSTDASGDVGPAERLSSMIATRVSVQDALTDLPRLYRVPVSLRDVDGLTYAEIADGLQLSVGTVKSQVSRGRAMLAGRLRPTLRSSLG